MKPNETSTPVYKDARTGFFKTARFVQTRDRHWGSLRFEGERWALIRRNADGTESTTRTGFTTGPVGVARTQRTLDVINGPQALPNGKKKKA